MDAAQSSLTSPVEDASNLLPVTTEPKLQPARLWAVTLVFTLLAAVAAMIGTERYREHHVPLKHRSTAMGNPMVIAPEAQAKADRQNALIVFSIQGAAIGLALGLAGGLNRGCMIRSAAGLVLGAILGAFAGFGASAGLHTLYFNKLLGSEDQLTKDMFFPMMIRGGLSAAIGFAAGLAFSVGFDMRPKRVAKAMMGGVLGGVLGAGLYDVLAALVYPSDKTNQPLAQSWEPRAIAIGALFMLIAIVTIAFVSSPEPKTEPLGEPA